MHKFHEFWSYEISKTKQENNANKIFIEIKILWVQSQKKKKIFSKEYFSSDFFALITL